MIFKNGCMIVFFIFLRGSMLFLSETCLLPNFTWYQCWVVKWEVIGLRLNKAYLRLSWARTKQNVLVITNFFFFLFFLSFFRSKVIRIIEICLSHANKIIMNECIRLCIPLNPSLLIKYLYRCTG